MSELNCIEMSGLCGNHPLGFLAACGLLRLVSTNQSARLGWKIDQANGGWTATLALDVKQPKTESAQDELVRMVNQSAIKFIQDLDNIGIKEAELSPSEFRTCSERALSPTSASYLVSSLGTDVVQRRKESGKNKGKSVIRTTSLAMTSGQQDLISGARKVAEKFARPPINGIISETVSKGIKEALFGPWTYQDDEHSLGWDPNSQRLHALRNKAPTNDGRKRSVSGAVFLATQALPLFPCFARAGKAQTLGFDYDANGDWFSWPIWSTLISLATLRSLLAQPFTADLKRRGVELIYRSRRVRTGGAEGNYQIFSSAEQRPWPNRRPL